MMHALRLGSAGARLSVLPPRSVFKRPFQFSRMMRIDECVLELTREPPTTLECAMTKCSAKTDVFQRTVQEDSRYRTRR